MTLTINATVRDIDVDHNGNSIVRLDAVAGETVDTGQSYNGKPYTPDQITSNTEGKVLAAQIILTVEGSEPPMEIGKVVSFGGHFDRTAKPVETVAPVEAQADETTFPDGSKVELGTSEVHEVGTAAGTPSNTGVPLGGTTGKEETERSADEEESAQAED